MRIVIGAATLAILSLLILPSSPAQAQLSAEVARICRDEAIRLYPYQQPGTGSGSAAAQRQAFQECVTRHNNSQESKQSGPTNEVGAKH